MQHTNGGGLSFSNLKKLPKLICYERIKIRTTQQLGCPNRPDHESSSSDLSDKSRDKSAQLALLTYPL